MGTRNFTITGEASIQPRGASAEDHKETRDMWTYHAGNPKWETLDYDGKSKWCFWFQSACNQVQWMEWNIIDTVLTIEDYS